MELKEYAAVIAIGLLFALFFGLLADAFYDAPQYDDFCKTRYQPSTYPVEKAYPAEQIQCTYTQEHKDAVQSCYDQKGNPVFDYNTKGCEVYKSCDFCNTEYQAAQNKYNRNLFFILAPVGGLAVILGILWTSTVVVGSGIMFGGILLLFYSTFRYFTNMSKIMRVVVIFVELVLLIIIVLKKLEAHRKKK